MTRSPALFSPLTAALALSIACKSGAPPEPESRKRKEPVAVATTTARATASAAPGEPKAPPKRRKIEAKPVAEVAVAEGDPVKGKFTMEDATKGLPAGGDLVAELATTKGKLRCELWPDKAPITVANFVGLARGLRPWKATDGKWVQKPIYDGTPFHRVIKGFMIQGGDPEGTGRSGPGFAIPDEIWEDAHHDERGLICMANRGPNTNGSQFFIMDGVAAHLDGGYTIFGKCGPEDVIESISGVATTGDRATDPVKITKVTVKREAKK